MHCYILLPAFNEITSLQQLVPEISQALATIPHTIVVIDDGSSDGTASRLPSAVGEASLKLLPHAHNQGYGASLRTGFLWIATNGQPEDVVVAMDADTTHEPRYLERFLKKFEAGAEVVTGSYLAPGASHTGLPPIRRLLSGGANLLFRLAFPSAGLQTYTNGFRGYRVGLLQRLVQQFDAPVIVENGFAGGTELFLKAVRSGAKAAEVPFDLHYEKRGRASKIRFGKTIRGYLKLLWRLKSS